MHGTSRGMRLPSKPNRSHREFHEKDRRNAYRFFEALRKRVRSSPRTMTRSGQSFFASLISCNLYKPWGRQRADSLKAYEGISGMLATAFPEGHMQRSRIATRSWRDHGWGNKAIAPTGVGDKEDCVLSGVPRSCR